MSQPDHDHIGERKMEVFLQHKLLGWNEEKIFERDLFNVEPVDFNVLYAQNMESLARLCTAAGDAEGAKRYGDRAAATRQAIFSLMWDGDKYVDLIGKAHRRSPVKSAAMFYPMMLEGEPHGRHLVQEHLANAREFDVTFGVPTTSVDHPRFRGGQYWRGNVWLNVNTFIWQGLQQHLAEDPDFDLARTMAAKVKDASFALLDRGGFCEYFDPETGEGHGAESFGWNGIVRLMEPGYR